MRALGGRDEGPLVGGISTLGVRMCTVFDDCVGFGLDGFLWVRGIVFAQEGHSLPWSVL